MQSPEKYLIYSVYGFEWSWMAFGLGQMGNQKKDIFGLFSLLQTSLLVILSHGRHTVMSLSYLLNTQ